jgi:hypothetical protein
LPDGQLDKFRRGRNAIPKSLGGGVIFTMQIFQHTSLLRPLIGKLVELFYAD